MDDADPMSTSGPSGQRRGVEAVHRMVDPCRRRAGRQYWVVVRRALRFLLHHLWKLRAIATGRAARLHRWRHGTQPNALKDVNTQGGWTNRVQVGWQELSARYG